MKSKFYLPLIAMAIGMGSCTNDLVEEVSPIMGQRDVIAVSVDNADTRTAMEGYNVVWSENDAIGVFVGTTNNEYGLTSEPGTTSGDFQSKGLVVASAETLKEAAYFPYVQGATWANNVITTTLPSTYEYAEGTNNNAVMAALMTEDAQSSISFQNAGALYAITIENILEGYDKAVMTYLDADDNVGIAGAATITFNSNGEPTLAVLDATDAASAHKAITITFSGTGDKTFYFPMPVKTEGYAGKLQFSLQGEGKDAITAPVFTKEPVRSNLYSVTLKLDNVSGGIVTEASDIDAANTELAKDAVTSVAVKDATDTDAITIPAKSAESAAVEHTIDLSEATLPDGAVNIVVEEADGEGATVDKLTVIVPEGTSAGSYTINAPGTTVTIQGSNGTVIETIEATTAENTLIIGAGLTINSLTIKKGNVELSADAAIKKFTVPTGVTTTLNLNNHTLSIDNPNATYGLINFGKMSIKDGEIVFKGDNTNNGSAVYNAGQIQLDDVDITSNNGCFINYGDATIKKLDGLKAEDATVTAVINGGTFNSSFCKTESHTKHRYAVSGFWYSNLIMDGTTIKGSGGVTVDVSFATLTNVNAEHACKHGAHDLYVPCGNATVTNCNFANAAAYSDDTYGQAVVNGVTYQNGTTSIPTWVEIGTTEELESAFTNGGSYKLTSSLEVTKALQATKPIALLMSDNVKLTIKVSGTYGLINFGKMSIKDGEIVFEGDNTNNGSAVYNAGQIQLDDVDITSNNGCFINYGDATIKKLDGLKAEDATVTAVINGGTFNSSFCKTESHTKHRYAVSGFWYSNLIMDGTTIKGSGGVTVDVSFATLTNVNAEHACKHGAHDLYVPCGNATVTNCNFANAAAYSDDTYGQAVVNGVTYQNGTTPINMN